MMLMEFQIQKIFALTPRMELKSVKLDDPTIHDSDGDSVVDA